MLMWLLDDQEATGRRQDVKSETSLWHRKSKAMGSRRWVFPRRNTPSCPEIMTTNPASVWQHMSSKGCNTFKMSENTPDPWGKKRPDENTSEQTNKNNKAKEKPKMHCEPPREKLVRKT